MPKFVDVVYILQILYFSHRGPAYNCKHFSRPMSEYWHAILLQRLGAVLCKP